MTSEAPASTAPQGAVRQGVQELKAIWWWFLILGVFWTLFCMFVLSYRVGSVYAVAASVGWAFIISGFTQFAVARRIEDWSWVFVVLGILSVVTGIVTLAWVGSLTAVAALVGVAFLFGGVGQLIVAGRVETLRPLLIITGIRAEQVIE